MYTIAANVTLPEYWSSMHRKESECLQTWLYFVLDPGHEVILSQQQLIVQIRNGQVAENAHAFQRELLLFFLHNSRRHVADVVLPRKAKFVTEATKYIKAANPFNQFESRLMHNGQLLTINKVFVGPSCCEMFRIIFIRSGSLCLNERFIRYLQQT